MTAATARGLIAEAMETERKIAQAEADMQAGRVILHGEVMGGLRQLIEEADARRAAR